MAKFKRFDARNKKASEERKRNANKRDKLTHHILASQKLRKTNEKVFYPREEELEL
jgi:hypothetical protein